GSALAAMLVSELSLETPQALTGLDAVQQAVWARGADLWALVRHGFIQPDGHSAAVERVSRSLDAVRDGRFVKITASASSAQLAAQLANAAGRAVTTLSGGVTRAAAEAQIRYLETQTDEARRQADAARQKVLDYATRSDAIQSASVLAAAAERDQARTAARQNEIALVDARERLAEVEAELWVTPQLQTVTTSTGTARTSTVSLSPVFVALRDRVSAARQDVAALEARAAKLEADTQARESNFRTLLIHDSALSAMNQDLALANEGYSRVARDLALARAEIARAVPEIREIDRAVAPVYPAFPVRVQFALIAALAVLLFAMIVLFAGYSTDTVLRSPAEAEAALADLRLLAVLPRRSGGGLVGWR
ncbi:MAG: hypothetical protein ABI466_08730, partial [Chloroflexota bacterium]